MKKVCIVNLSTQDSTLLNPEHNPCDTDWLCLTDHLVKEREYYVYLHNPYSRKKAKPKYNIKTIGTSDLLNNTFDEIYLNFQPYHIKMAAGHGIRPFMIDPILIDWIYKQKNIYCLFLDTKPGSTPPIWEYAKEWDIEEKLRRDRCNKESFFKLKEIITEKIIPIFTSIEMYNSWFKHYGIRKYKIIDLYKNKSIFDYILTPINYEKKFNLTYCGYNITSKRKERLEFLSKNITDKVTFGNVELDCWSTILNKKINAQQNIDIMAASKGQLITYDNDHHMVTLRIYQTVKAQSLLLLDSDSPLLILEFFKNKGLEGQIVENSQQVFRLLESSIYDELIQHQNKEFSYESKVKSKVSIESLV